MKLLLDEMISPRVARELGEHGHDAVAIKKDRPELMGCEDRELVRRMAGERRVIVTNDLADYQLLHDRLLATGKEHYGMIFTHDAVMPRTKEAIPRWVKALCELLAEHPGEHSLHNRIHHLADRHRG